MRLIPADVFYTIAMSVISYWFGQRGSAGGRGGERVGHDGAHRGVEGVEAHRYRSLMDARRSSER